VTLVAAVGHGAGRDLKSREQRGGPVALLVVLGLLRESRTERKDRLGAIERLDLRLLIHAEHDRVVGRVQIQADDVADLGLQLGSVENLNVPRRHGCTR
jgi:hypothetical protein